MPYTMGCLSPYYFVILPFVCFFTIPIAIFASITTTFAFSILLFRVTLVYLELAFAVIPHYLIGSKAAIQPLPPATALSTANAVPVRRRKRRTSTSSNFSGGSITPVASETNLGLSQSIGQTRDFEGVGGWRLDHPSDDDALWTNINSRLELPADHVRRHRRSLTSASLPPEVRHMRSYSPEATMNTSRARTPPTTGLWMRSDGYFPQLPMSPIVSKRTPSVGAGGSASSGSSKGSSVSSMKPK
ncbi:hypothetical protein B7494_g647 [Chlorociboria aeruginascens]|nr:hypothetical protein B7494_g647 [Chlorociboria aeruginascens]